LRNFGQRRPARGDEGQAGAACLGDGIAEPFVARRHQRERGARIQIVERGAIDIPAQDHAVCQTQLRDASAHDVDVARRRPNRDDRQFRNRRGGG